MQDQDTGQWDKALLSAIMADEYEAILADTPPQARTGLQSRFEAAREFSKAAQERTRRRHLSSLVDRPVACSIDSEAPDDPFGAASQGQYDPSHDTSATCYNTANVGQATEGTSKTDAAGRVQEIRPGDCARSQEQDRQDGKRRQRAQQAAITRPWPKYELVNLREVLGLYGWEFAICIDIHESILGTLRSESSIKQMEAQASGSLGALVQASSGPSSSEAVSEERIKALKSGISFKRLRALADPLQMRSVARHFETFDLATSSAITYAELIAWYEQLKVRLLEELEERWFLFVPSEFVQLHREPLTDWGDVPNKFPSAKNEIMSASQCLALGQGTACVFHAMRIVESGLNAFGDELGVNKTTLATKPWGSVLNEAELAIPGKIKSIADAEKKKEAAEFYHWCGTQIEHFREAWRDRVSHRVRTYNVPGAQGVLLAVRSFMVKIVERGLSETP